MNERGYIFANLRSINEPMLKMQIRWVWVAIVSAVMVGVLLAIYRYHYVWVGSDVYRIDAVTGHFCKYPCVTIPPQVLASQGPTPTPFNLDAYMATQPMNDQLRYARAKRLQLLQASKPMSMSNFGQQTEAVHFRLNALFHDVLEASDGRLWVIYETCAFIGAGGCSRYHFAMLDGDQLTEIWLPHDHGEWNIMNLTSASTPDAPVVRVNQGGTTPRQYRVTEHDIIQGPVSDEVYLSNTATNYDKHLQSGETCRLNRSPASPTLVNAVGAHGRVRPLVSKSDFLAATQNIVQVSDPDFIYCTHFLEADLLIVGYGESQATLVIAPGLWLASPGAPFAITKHHLVQFTDVLDERGAPTGSWDYVNVTGKRP